MTIKLQTHMINYYLLIYNKSSNIQEDWKWLTGSGIWLIVKWRNST